MIGTLEDMEKEIEQFQKNVMASGEIVNLLKQMLSMVKVQNESFEKHSKELLGELEEVPNKIDDANANNNIRVKEDVSEELSKALLGFRDEQNKYIDNLDQTKNLIRSITDLTEERGKDTNARLADLLQRFSSMMDQLRQDCARSNQDMVSSVDKVLEERNAQFLSEQERYRDELKNTQSVIKTAEEQLEKSYKEFTSTLNELHVANLNEQNQQLKKDLSKRTTILIVITSISVILGIVGLIL